MAARDRSDKLRRQRGRRRRYRQGNEECLVCGSAPWVECRRVGRRTKSSCMVYVDDWHPARIGDVRLSPPRCTYPLDPDPYLWSQGLLWSDEG